MSLLNTPSLSYFVVVVGFFCCCCFLGGLCFLLNSVYMFYRDMHCGFRAVVVHVFSAVPQSAGICHQHLQGCHFSGHGQISWPRELLEQALFWVRKICEQFVLL